MLRGCWPLSAEGDAVLHQVADVIVAQDDVAARADRPQGDANLVLPAAAVVGHAGDHFVFPVLDADGSRVMGASGGLSATGRFRNGAIESGHRWFLCGVVGAVAWPPVRIRRRSCATGGVRQRGNGRRDRWGSGCTPRGSSTAARRSPRCGRAEC